MALEPRQDDLLGRILAGPLLDADTLREAGALSDSSAESPSEAEGIAAEG